MLEQQFDDFDAVLLAGDVERRESVERARVGVRLAVQEELRDADVAAVRRHVQRRQVVDGHLVHGRPVVQQDARRVHVVPLGGHVQRSKTVLPTQKNEKLTNHRKGNHKQTHRRVVQNYFSRRFEGCTIIDRKNAPPPPPATT